ncbi:MAG: hypothetical protein IPF51_11040 [Dehalococcoidia bacterium]|uniref:hypothetical protein n=1 Tax=Candidatus Amarobacter glycogenicus TaxID=3140699 RepID=UPI002A10EA51|nr:hypothetical protein [Dehalococcoidia bacterium]MBK9609964.1 hypothetical protein [Dehalococcoidia bacterium]MCC6269524.1 hypothetical protein [Dehalococcoidia bacterium]
MRHAVSSSSLPSVRTISRRAELTPAGIAEAATRLRSWALCSGEQMAGPAFLRIAGDLHCEVHLPVAGRARPRGETGISAELSEGGQALALGDVPFASVREVIRELGGEIALDYGMAGAVEFHPDSPEFRRGTLLWPVHRMPRKLSHSEGPQLAEAGG